MASRRYKRAIGTFPHRKQAEAALNELRDSGFSMDRVSVLQERVITKEWDSSLAFPGRLLVKKYVLQSHQFSGFDRDDFWKKGHFRFYAFSTEARKIQAEFYSVSNITKFTY